MAASDTISPTLITFASKIQSNPSNVGIRISDNIYTAHALMDVAINYQRFVVNTAPSWAFSNTISNAKANLTTLSNRLYFGGPMNCLQVFFRVKTHLDSAAEIKETSDRMANTSVADLGSGVTNLSSASTQGLGALGNLTSVSNVIRLMGPAYDLTEMKYFGTGVGLVKKLSAARIIKSTGVQDALIRNNVDLTRLDDPVYADTIDATLATITNTSALDSATEEFGVTPLTKLVSFKDFTDIDKFVPTNQQTGLVGGLKGIATKFGDLNAQFETADDALTMLSTIETPQISYLDSASSNLGSLMSSISSDISSGTGASIIASDPRGIPNMTDFLEPIAGGTTISQVITSNVSVASITDLNTMITRTYNLFSTVKIDITGTTTHVGAVSDTQLTLDYAKSLGMQVEALGAQDTTNSNAATVLVSLTSADLYGDTVKALLADGKNKAALSKNKVIPLRY